MAYGLKYYGTLKDYFNRTITVNIYENSYSGSSTEVTLSGISKQMNGSDNELFQTIIGTSVSVGFLNTTNFQFIDLYTGNARKYKMEVKIDSDVDWVGWIVPELFTEPYDAPPYVTTITARCGLAELDSFDFDLTGVKTHVDILTNILIKITGAFPSLNNSVAIFEENHDTTESPLYQTYSDCERYEGMTCREVVEDLCNVWGARLYQSDGEWWFVNQVDFQNELSVVKYKVASTDKFTKDTELLIGRPQEDKFANVDQQLNILPAWKSIHINREFGLKDSALKNSDFSNWTDSGGSITPDNWSQSVTGLVTQYVSEDNLAAYFTKNNATPNYHIKQELLNFVESPQTIRIELKFKTLNYVGTAQFWIRVILEGASSRYLTSTGIWSTTNAFINFQNISPANQNSSFQTYGINAPGIPIDGKLVVEVYASDYGNLVMDSVVVELRNPISMLKYEESIPYNISVSDNTTIKDIDILSGDAPDVPNIFPVPTDYYPNEQHAYSGLLYLTSDKSQLTQQWRTKNDIDNPPLLDLLAQLHIVVNAEKGTKVQLPQWALSGSILAKNIKIDSTIVDYQISSKKYLVCNGTYDMENCIFNGTYIEIGSWSGAQWILDGGIYNDNGIWIDTEFWED